MGVLLGRPCLRWAALGMGCGRRTQRLETQGWTRVPSCLRGESSSFYSFYFTFYFYLFYVLFLTFYLFIFREQRRQGERESNISVWSALTRPLLGTRPTAQTCALTGNRTGDPWVRRLVLNPLNHTSRGSFYFSMCLDSLL